jgi:hypothetical protein
MARFELERLTEFGSTAMLGEIRRVAGLVGSGPLTQTAFEKYSKVSSSAVRKRFGGWRQALEAAGLGELYSGQPVTDAMRKRCVRRLADGEILAQLARVAHSLGSDTLTQAQFNAYASINSATVLRRFGSWAAGLERAGLRIHKGATRYTEEDYFENLLAVWTHYGRQPRNREMDEPPSRITAGAYEHRFGKWTNALIAFVNRMNEENEPSGQTRAQTVAPDPPLAHARQRNADAALSGDRHGIRLSLRYMILKRDGFRCVLCGRSPATHRDCNLHVDHVMPSSKGGPTTPGNLRTTCSLCNIGKGARTEA